MKKTFTTEEALKIFQDWAGFDLVIFLDVVRKYGGEVPAQILDAAKRGNLFTKENLTEILLDEQDQARTWDARSAIETCDRIATRVGVDLIKKRLTGTRCSDCGEEQFNTRSGVTCPLGHGGADPVEDDR